MAENAPGSEQVPDVGLRRWWAAAGLVLLGATWKLWTPQTEFPQVPLFGWAVGIPSFVDWLPFGVLLGSLALAARYPDSQRSWWACIASLSSLIIFDQHRLQPWVWQLWLMAVFWGCDSVEKVFNLPRRIKVRQVEIVPLMLLTISIYFWSAVSKFEARFYASHGKVLVEAFFQSIGLEQPPGDTSWKQWYGHLLPIGELLVAAGLSWRITRPVALVAATAMHIGLILALGPTGLGHRPGVLLWNVAFLGHNWLLFGRSRRAVLSFCRRVDEEVASAIPVPLSRLRRTGAVIVLFACVWPITEGWGLCDRWLAWSLYSARSDRVTVWMRREGTRRLPELAQQAMTGGELLIDRWSLGALDAPIYPQLRFQRGVVEWLRRRCGDESLIEICVWPAPDGEFAGDGSNYTVCGEVEQFDERSGKFWFNTRPRD